MRRSRPARKVEGVTVGVQRATRLGSGEDLWRVAGHLPGDRAFLLDSATHPGALGRYTLLGCAPFAELRAWVIAGAPPGANALLRLDVHRDVGAPSRWAVGTHTWPGDLFAVLDEIMATYAASAEHEALPFAGGAVGYIGYEARHFSEAVASAPVDPDAPPAVHLMLVDAVAGVDHHTHEAWVCGTGWGPTGADARRAATDQARHLSDRIGAIGQVPPTPPITVSTGSTLTVRRAAGPERYGALVGRIQEHLRAGDAYEVCLTQQMEVDRAIDDPWRLYQHLREVTPAPFASYLRLGDLSTVSSSPERFLSLAPDGHAESRPIKGTRPRGRTPDEDRALAHDLGTALKDRAENVMIVDLVRNDLARVCEPGSVEVPQLLEVEAYATVFQLVSSITGQVGPGQTAARLLRACFPGGSMTGAPKIAAMDIIAGLEATERSIYSGAIGYFDARGTMDLSIVIRTCVIDRGRCTFGVGGAVVADSDPVGEHEEALDKAHGMVEAIRRYAGADTVRFGGPPADADGDVPARRTEPTGRRPRVVVIDNYDSFTYNVVDHLRRAGADVQVHRNDAVTAADVERQAPAGIVLSPGPGGPADGGVCLDVVRRLGSVIPILGICLGHQVIAEAYGGRVVSAPEPRHGKTSPVDHDGCDLFAGAPHPLRVMRYHSLMVDPATLPADLAITAMADDGVIMGIRHRSDPVVGVQFHPESILTEHGPALMRSWVVSLFAPTPERTREIAHR